LTSIEEIRDLIVQSSDTLISINLWNFTYKETLVY